MDTIEQILERLWGSVYVQKNPTKSYKTQYNTEYLAVAKYMTEGIRPNTTGYSQMGLVLVGLEDHVRAGSPDPNPEPIQHDVVFSKKSDFEGFFNMWKPTGWYGPASSGTPWENGGGCFQLSNGMRYVATPQMEAWTVGSGNKLAQGLVNGTIAAQLRDKRVLWRWKMKIPTADNLNGFNTWWGQNVLMQFGTTGGSVGHEFIVNPDGRIGFYLRSKPEQWPNDKYLTAIAPAVGSIIDVEWEQWWSETNGRMRGKINGIQLMDISGPTMWNGETIRHLGIGWYSGPENKNAVEYYDMGYSFL